MVHQIIDQNEISGFVDLLTTTDNVEVVPIKLKTSNYKRTN